MKYIDEGLDERQLATLDAWIAKREARVAYPEWRTDKERSAYSLLMCRRTKKAMCRRTKKATAEPSWQHDRLSQEQLNALYNAQGSPALQGLNSQCNPYQQSVQSVSAPRLVDITGDR